MLQRLSLLAPLLLAACAQELSLPAYSSQPPQLARVEPAQAYAGETVLVRGEAFAAAGAQVEVRFGDGPAVVPSKVSADGRVLTVQVPQELPVGRALSVAVTTGAGRAALAKSFLLLGAGQLRAGRPGATSDVLRPHVTFVQPTSTPGEVLVFLPELGMPGLFSLASGLQPTGVYTARALDASANAFLSLGADPVTKTAALDLVDLPPYALPAVRAHAALPVEVDVKAPAVALDGAARRALVAISGGLWAVDFAQSPPAVHAVAPLPAFSAAQVKWLAGSRFLLVADGAPWLVDAATSFAQPLSLPFAGPEWGPVLAVDVARLSGPGANNPLVALAYGTGAVQLVSGVALGSPSLSGQIDSLGQAVGALAFSADQTTLALALPADGRVTLVDLTKSPPRLVGAAEMAEPASVAAGPGGVFYVGGAGAVGLVAQATGALVSRIPVQPAWTSPQVRWVDCGDGHAAEVLEVVSSTLDYLSRLDPATLGVARCNAPLPQLPGNEGYALETAAVPGSLALVSGAVQVTPGALWVRLTDGVHTSVAHVGTDAQSKVLLRLSEEESAAAFDPEGRARRQLVAMPSGGVLVRRALPAGSPGVGEEVLLVEPDAAGVPPRFVVEQQAVAFGASRRVLVLASPQEVRFLDLTQARHGIESQAWPSFTMPAAQGDVPAPTVRQVVVAHERAFVLAIDAWGQSFVAQIALDTGKRTGLLQATGYLDPSTLVASPSGSALWGLGWAGGWQLHTISFDQQGFLVELPPAELPVSTSGTNQPPQLVGTSTGELLIALDPQEARLVTLQ